MHCPSKSSNYWTTALISHASKVMFVLFLCLVTQLCPTLCYPMGCNPACSSVHGIFQARILEWVAIFLLQGIFLIQESNQGLLHCRWILYHRATREAQATQGKDSSIPQAIASAS